MNEIARGNTTGKRTEIEIDIERGEESKREKTRSQETRKKKEVERVESPRTRRRKGRTRRMLRRPAKKMKKFESRMNLEQSLDSSLSEYKYSLCIVIEFLVLHHSGYHAINLCRL